MLYQSKSLKIVFLILIGFSLNASAVTPERKDKAAHAAAKAAAMKYLKERKPAQEGQITSMEDMRTEMSGLFGYLNSDATNRDKFQAIQSTRYRMGLGLKVLLKNTAISDEKIQEAYRYDNTMIYLTQLKLDAKGEWTAIGCNHAITMIGQHGYNPASDTTNIESSDQNILVVIKRMCGQ